MFGIAYFALYQQQHILPHLSPCFITLLSQDCKRRYFDVNSHRKPPYCLVLLHNITVLLLESVYQRPSRLLRKTNLSAIFLQSHACTAHIHRYVSAEQLLYSPTPLLPTHTHTCIYIHGKKRKKRQEKAKRQLSGQAVRLSFFFSLPPPSFSLSLPHSQVRPYIPQNASILVEDRKSQTVVYFHLHPAEPFYKIVTHPPLKRRFNPRQTFRTLTECISFVEDEVYMPNASWLEEYVLNDHGILYQGSADSISATRWYFGQVLKRNLFSSIAIYSSLHFIITFNGVVSHIDFMVDLQIQYWSKNSIPEN